MEIYATSDEHYNHINIIKYTNRPYKDVNEMNEALIANHNSVVKNPDDQVWHMGDFSMSENIVQRILSRLNGTHYLVPGNHCKCHPVNKGWEAAKQRYLLYGFAGIYLQVENFHGFVLNHLPYEEPNEYGKRFLHYRPIYKEGQFLLHGHVHSTPETKLRKNMLDVGVDGNNYLPYHLDEIKALVDKQRLIVKTNSQ
jgi:calcineurin-like phosphoesterase family protein